MSEDMSEIMSKDRSERMAKDMSEWMSERYVRRYVIRKSVKRFVRKNGKRYVRKMSEWMSEDMSERMSEDMSGRTSENMSQVYVHTQIWITRIHVCTNGILWMASCFLFYLAYCSKYCWLNFVFVQGSEFGLEAMAEVVVERPETIFIGTANQVALHTPWDVVVALQTLLHFWTQLPFGGAVWCMWCVCVWNYRRFASLDLTAFWRGGPMHWGRWHLQAQSCHGYYFCCVVRGKYRVCRAAFLWSCGC